MLSNLHYSDIEHAVVFNGLANSLVFYVIYNCIFHYQTAFKDVLRLMYVVLNLEHNAYFISVSVKVTSSFHKL